VFIAFLYLLDFNDPHLAVKIKKNPVAANPQPVSILVIGQGLHSSAGGHGGQTIYG
jgi:hypothetical protein